MVHRPCLECSYLVYCNYKVCTVKLGICTINHGRKKILHLYLASIKRLRQEIEDELVVVVVSDEEDKDLCERYGVHHIIRPNKPTSVKWDVGCAWLRTQEVDYVCIMGSDDIASTELMKNILREMRNGYSVIGIKEIFFYGTYGRYKGLLLRFICKRICGVAKTISKEVLDKIDWKVSYIERNHGMDALISKRIRQHIKSEKIVEGMCFDIKTEHNMNRISLWSQKVKTPSDPELLYSILSEEEKKILLNI